MNFEEAKFKAIKYLGISKKTKYQVTEKLSTLGTENDLIEKVIEYLIDLKYINDDDYAESFIRQNERMEKYSIFEICEKLKQKGIPVSIIEEKIDKLRLSDYEKNIVSRIRNMKSRNLDEIKIKQYLYRRGFKNI